MANRKEVTNQITSVKNIRQITRAMEMVAAARLRRAEMRIQHLRPYAQAMRRMTQRAADQAFCIMASTYSQFTSWSTKASRYF